MTCLEEAEQLPSSAARRFCWYNAQSAYCVSLYLQLQVSAILLNILPRQGHFRCMVRCAGRGRTLRQQQQLAVGCM